MRRASTRGRRRVRSRNVRRFEVGEGYRPRRDDPGEHPVDRASVHEQLHARRTFHTAHGVDKLRQPRVEALRIAPQREAQAEVDASHTVHDRNTIQPRGRRNVATQPLALLSEVGPARSADTASTAVDPGRSTESICSPCRNETLNIGADTLDPTGSTKTRFRTRMKTTTQSRRTTLMRGTPERQLPSIGTSESILNLACAP